MSAPHDIAFHKLGSEQPKGRHVALVPGAQAPLLTLDLPTGLRGPAREDVARRQLRDLLGAGGTTIEMRPFSASGKTDNWQRAIVAEVAQVHIWRAQANPDCQAVLPDYLALPASEGVWCVEVSNNSVKARLGLEDGFSCDGDMAVIMLARALEDPDLTPPKALFLLGEHAGVSALFTARHVPVVHDIAAVAELGLLPPAVLGHSELDLDLRTDPRAARERLERRVLPWRWPLLIGLLAGGLWSAAQVIGTRAIEAEIQTERAATLALVRQEFVPAGPILDVRTQVARALAARQDAARDWQGRVSPLTLFGQVARVVTTTEAVSQDYAFENDTLTAVLQLADFAAAEALVADLSAADLDVEVVDLRVSDSASGVRAELRVRAIP